MGRPLKNVDVTADPEGRLWVNSRAVGETYWPEPETALSQRTFLTCDLGEIKDGEIILRGRTSEQINVAGRKVSPAIIEQALDEHEAVGECLVFGVPSGSADRLDLIVACVAATRPGSQEELKQFLLQKLPGWQVPREWWFVDALGINGHGKKIARALWRQNFLDNRARQTVLTQASV